MTLPAPGTSKAFQQPTACVAAGKLHDILGKESVIINLEYDYGQEDPNEGPISKNKPEMVATFPS